MKTFEVYAEMTTYLKTTVEAESEIEAYIKAKDLDGGDFTPLADDVGTWNIYHASEVTK